MLVYPSATNISNKTSISLGIRRGAEVGAAEVDGADVDASDFKFSDVVDESCNIK